MGELMRNLGLQPAVILSQILAFVFLYLVFRKFVFGAVSGMVEARNKEIKERLERAERDEHAMEEARKEYEARLADIEREARDRIQQATREAHEAGAQIVAQARTEREETIQRAREEIQREKERALIEIRDHVADLAVGGAERILRRQLDDAAHRELVSHFIAEVEQVR